MSDVTVQDLVSRILEGMESGAMLTKFIVIIEGIDNDGRRAIFADTNDGATVWDNLGLLDYVAERERASIHEDRRRE